MTTGRMRQTAARALRAAGTLRGRLTLALVAIVLVAGAVTALVTGLLLRNYLVSRADAQLTTASARFALALRHHSFAPGGSDGDSDDTAPGTAIGTLGARIVGGRVTVMVVQPDGSNKMLVLDEHDRDALAALPADGTAHSVELDALGDYRMRAVRGARGDVQVSGLSLHEIHEVIGRLAAIEVGVLALVTLACGVVTTIVVRRTLRPLGAVAATARHVSRLPLADAGTELPQVTAPASPRTEVDDVSMAFERMLAQVRDAFAERDVTEARLRRFVADASHELRTPLATIQAYSEYAQRGTEPDPETTRSALNRIDAASARMATLVDDLLLLARLDAGRPLEREQVDLTQVVIESVDDARTHSPGHRWRLELPDEPVEVVGDPARLHQVLGNLLGNAAAHTPPGTTVVARLRCEGPGWAVVEVHDDGPGIDPAVAATVFDRFSRGDASRSGAQGSTGLGLAIAHGIVTAHRGTVDVDSRPGATTFRVRIPALHAHPPQASPAGERSVHMTHRQ